VEYVDSVVASHMALLNLGNKGKVIISCGALGSPQLLLLSGIGPREHLESLGIPVVIDLPSVGQGMDDNPKVGITFLSPRLLKYSLHRIVGVNRGSFIKSSTISFHNPFTYNQEGTDIYTFNRFFGINVVNIFEFVVGPLTKGELYLRSRDFNEDP
jgi:hypothetical protein